MFSSYCVCVFVLFSCVARCLVANVNVVMFMFVCPVYLYHGVACVPGVAWCVGVRLCGGSDVDLWPCECDV